MSRDSSWQPAALAATADSRGGTPGTGRWVDLGGSALNAMWRLEAGGDRFFVKANLAARLPMLEAEADGLRELARAGAIRVPAPVACGSTGDTAFLVLEWLDFSGEGRDAALGAALARLHRTTSPRFGWHRDNTIGTTPQDNAWTDDWSTFVRDRRIAPQLALAARNGYGGPLQKDGEALLTAIPALLAGHSPVASLSHGDLWSGNAAQLASGEPVVFDPAVYFGDREADLAMAELFGGFGADFFAAYAAAWPLATGYASRRTLYNLYHVLNHVNLFGRGYLAQARSMIAELLAAVR